MSHGVTAAFPRPASLPLRCPTASQPRSHALPACCQPAFAAARSPRRGSACAANRGGASAGRGRETRARPPARRLRSAVHAQVGVARRVGLLVGRVERHPGRELHVALPAAEVHVPERDVGEHGAAAPRPVDGHGVPRARRLRRQVGGEVPRPLWRRRRPGRAPDPTEARCGRSSKHLNRSSHLHCSKSLSNIVWLKGSIQGRAHHGARPPAVADQLPPPGARAMVTVSPGVPQPWLNGFSLKNPGRLGKRQV
eukprot:gene10270-biopygen13215